MEWSEPANNHDGLLTCLRVCVFISCKDAALQFLMSVCNQVDIQHLKVSFAFACMQFQKLATISCLSSSQELRSACYITMTIKSMQASGTIKESNLESVLWHFLSDYFWSAVDTRRPWSNWMLFTLVIVLSVAIVMLMLYLFWNYSNLSDPHSTHDTHSITVGVFVRRSINATLLLRYHFPCNISVTFANHS